MNSVRMRGGTRCIPGATGPRRATTNLLALVALCVLPAFAELLDHGQASPPGHVPPEQTAHGDHTATTGSAGQVWEGSPEGKAYSEFNHHLAGVFVLLIALSEFREGLALGRPIWTRFLLPGAMLMAGGYLMVWSDHDAWPVGSLGFVETFFTGDWETVQHKLYAVLLLGVGTVEFLRRLGRTKRLLWSVPLPVFAIIGGLLLLLHSHGAHPAAHKIALHHSVMGAMAITAGMCKLVPAWSRCRAPLSLSGAGRWELAWSGFILLIGLQLLIYAE